MSNLHPLHDIVIIKRHEAERVSPGGIVIPDKSVEKLAEGTVVDVGPGRPRSGIPHEPSLKKGDHVLFGKYAGTEIVFENEDLILMRESEILGVIEKDNGQNN